MQATIHGVAKSRARLSDFTNTASGANISMVLSKYSSSISYLPLYTKNRQAEAMPVLLLITVIYFFT